MPHNPDDINEIAEVGRVVDLAKDPDQYQRSVQSKVTVGGLMLPIGAARGLMSNLFMAYETYLKSPPASASLATQQTLTGKMRQIIERAWSRRKPMGPGPMAYVAIEPQDYTIFEAADIPVPVVMIHTKPEPSYFLGLLRFDGALGLSLGRMRIHRPKPIGEAGRVMYPVTIRTKWRGLSDGRIQQQVKAVWSEFVGEGP